MPRMPHIITPKEFTRRDLLRLASITIGCGALSKAADAAVLGARGVAMGGGGDPFVLCDELVMSGTAYIQTEWRPTPGEAWCDVSGIINVWPTSGREYGSFSIISRTSWRVNDWTVYWPVNNLNEFVVTYGTYWNTNQTTGHYHGTGIKFNVKRNGTNVVFRQTGYQDYSYTFSPISFTPQQIQIGNTSSTVSTSSSSLYAGAKFGNGSATELDLYPAIDKDGVSCVFDTIEKKPYYKIGSGTFEARNPIRTVYV